MSKAIAIIDMPETCGECLFCSALTEMYLGNGFYKKLGKCVLAKDIEDPWRNAYWQSEHKEEWCPLKPVPKKQMKRGVADDCYKDGLKHGFVDGWNAYFDKIINI